MTRCGLFDSLPQFPPALPDADLDLLAQLPEWPTTMEIFRDEDQTIVRRLERRGLVKVSRLLADPAGTLREWWVGKLPAAGLRRVGGEKGSDNG